MKKITVIVPAYNIVDYLERCVDSIIGQTYRNLEIILVDDGSTDGTDELCDRLAKKDSRILVKHKENGGLSDARNVGINLSTGDYLSFVDGDDFIDDGMYEVMEKAFNYKSARGGINFICCLWNVCADKRWKMY